MSQEGYGSFAKYPPIVYQAPEVKPLKWTAVKVRDDHPRLFFTRQEIPDLRRRCAAGPLRQMLEDYLGEASGDQQEKTVTLRAGCHALLYLVTGEGEHAARALELALHQEVHRYFLALVYDWCFDALSAAQKKALEKKLAAAVGLNGPALPWLSKYCDANRPLPSETPPESWPRFYNWTLHSEDWVDGSREAAWYTGYFALAGHHPQAAAVCQRQWELSWQDATELLSYLGDGSFWEGGYWRPRGKYRKLVSVYQVLKSACNLDFSRLPYLNNIGYFIIYGADLHRQRQWVFAYGDSGPHSSTAWQTRDNMLAANAFAKNPYYQWYLNHCTTPHNPFLEALSFDPELEEKPLTELPPSRLFTGTGLCVMRSGWEAGAVIASLRCGPWWDLHNHHDTCDLRYYRRGVLIGKPGYYGFASGRQHNTLQVFGYTPPSDENGGQRTYPRAWCFRLGSGSWWGQYQAMQRGRITAHENHDLFDYLAADGTLGYHWDCAESFTRQVVFLRRGVMIVFDRITNNDPACTNCFQLHVPGEPSLAEGILTGEFADYPSGQFTAVRAGPGGEAEGATLLVRTLLPERRKIRASRQPTDEHADACPWQVQVLSGEEGQTHRFLHVIYGLLPGESAPEIKPLREMVKETVGLAVKLNGQEAALRFRSQGPTGGSILLTDQLGNKLVHKTFTDCVELRQP